MEITGGEPLVQEEVLTLMDRLCDLGYEVLLETGGSLDNASRLASGEAHLAFLQNDAPRHPRLRTLAPLYDDVLHVIVRAGLATDLHALMQTP